MVIMTFWLFTLGMAVMATGFACVRYTDFMLRNFGDISEMFGLVNARWISWKMVGLFFMIGGFLIAFNIYGLFIERVFELMGIVKE